MKFSIVSGTNYQSQSTYPGVDGVKYTVTSTVAWATDSGVETSCTTPTTAGSSQYLRIRSTVTWPAMGTAKPVVADSIMAPRGREANRTTGSLMVKVNDRDAHPVGGAVVVVSGQSLTTNSNGCVFFPAVPAGQWPVTITKGSFMDSDGHSPGSAQASIVVNDVSTLSVSFDNPASFNPVTFVDETGAQVTPQTPSLTLTNASKTIAFPGKSVSDPVFPFASGWSVYAGSCVGNSPATYASSPWTSLPGSTSIPAPGATVSGKAYMRVLNLKLGDTLYSGGGMRVEYFIKPLTGDSTYNYMSTDCPSVTGYITITDNQPQNVSIPVPYGLYTICVDNTNTRFGQTNATRSYGYRYKRFTSSTAPTGAFHATPTIAGMTLKSGVPAPDSSSTWDGTLNSGGPWPSSPQCS
jgi:hypothetical protein